MSDVMKKEIKKVFFSYLKGLGIVLGIIILAFLIYTTNVKVAFDIGEEIVKIFRFISASFIAIALFGRLGWDIQTFCGNTPPEKLNNIIYKYLYGIGFFFLVLSILL